jgi:hypothetical protein
MSVAKLREISFCLYNMWRLPEALKAQDFELAYNITVAMNGKIDDALANRAGKDTLIYSIQATAGLVDVLLYKDREYLDERLNPYAWTLDSFSTRANWQATRII